VNLADINLVCMQLSSGLNQICSFKGPQYALNRPFRWREGKIKLNKCDYVLKST